MFDQDDVRTDKTPILRRSFGSDLAFALAIGATVVFFMYSLHHLDTAIEANRREISSLSDEVRAKLWDAEYKNILKIGSNDSTKPLLVLSDSGAVINGTTYYVGDGYAISMASSGAMLAVNGDLHAANNADGKSSVPTVPTLPGKQDCSIWIHPTWETTTCAASGVAECLRTRFGLARLPFDAKFTPTALVEYANGKKEVWCRDPEGRWECITHRKLTNSNNAATVNGIQNSGGTIQIHSPPTAIAGVPQIPTSGVFSTSGTMAIGPTKVTGKYIQP